MEKELEQIVESLFRTKGLTKKTTERLVVDLISDKAKLSLFQKQLTELEKNFGVCPRCFFVTYQQICEICSNLNRDQKVICVVATILDVLNIEKHHKYKGVYAVLGGEINLSHNVAPENLKIAELFQRVQPGDELILALNATFEGEVTANYIAKLGLGKNLKITRIAKGIPMGGMLDYMDEHTLESALKNRKGLDE